MLDIIYFSALMLSFFLRSFLIWLGYLQLLAYSHSIIILVKSSKLTLYLVSGSI